MLQTASRLTALQALACEAEACRACPLGETRLNVVWAGGNPNAQLMIVGEAPGQTEDETGQPFVGRAGKLLTAMLATAGLTRETDTYIANMLKCRPPNNRKPTPTEVAACAPFLQQQVALVQPKVLVLLGSTAVTGVLGLKQPLGHVRGQWFNLPSHPHVHVMPQYHPSYLLRFAQQPEGTHPANPRALGQTDWHSVANYLT